MYTVQLKVQLSIRIKKELAEAVKEYADKYTGGNVSRAVEELLERCLTTTGQ